MAGFGCEVKAKFGVRIKADRETADLKVVLWVEETVNSCIIWGNSRPLSNFNDFVLCDIFTMLSYFNLVGFAKIITSYGAFPNNFHRPLYIG